MGREQRDRPQTVRGTPASGYVQHVEDRSEDQPIGDIARIWKDLHPLELPGWKKGMLAALYISRSASYRTLWTARRTHASARTITKAAWTAAVEQHPGLQGARGSMLQWPHHASIPLKQRALERSGTRLSVTSWSEYTLKLSAVGSAGNANLIDPAPLSSPEAGDISALCLELASVWGNSDFVGAGASLIIPDGCDPLRDLHPMEQRGRLKFVAQSDSELQALVQPPKTGMRGTFLRLTGSCSGNYSHWLLEYLPRLVQMRTLQPRPLDGVLVDAWIHPRFVESIEWALGSVPQLIKVPRDQGLLVQRLLDIRHPNYHPPMFRSPGSPSQPTADVGDVIPFDRYALQSLRDLRGRTVNYNSALYPKRIHLLRPPASTGNLRLLENEDLLQRLLSPLGFVSLDPAALSFEEQMRIFENAEVIVSPVGAALSNMVFSRSGTSVVALAPLLWEGDYSFFSHLATQCDIRLEYALGTHAGRLVQHSNQNFTVSLTEVADALVRLGLSLDSL
jgi:hypothetical protein